jgi:2'-5' RNA ligase
VAAPLQAVGGRPVAQADLHLTLCFLGAVQQSAIASLRWRAGQLQAAQFSLQFDRIEYWRESRVIVAVAPQAPSQALSLIHALESAVSELGIAPDRKPWRPHVTLARGVLPERALRGWQPGLPKTVQLEWSVDCFHLVESRKLRAEDLPAAQPRYALLASWPLCS